MASVFHIASSLTLDGILDYETDEGYKHFKRIIEKLIDELLDLVSEECHLLTNLLAERVDKIG